MKVICSYLKKKDLRSWHLQYTHKKSHEIYTINSEIEAIRCAGQR